MLSRSHASSGLPSILVPTAAVTIAMLAFFGFDESGQFRPTASPTAMAALEGADIVAAPDAPLQVVVAEPFVADLGGGYVATSRHRFQASGAVLGRKRYPRGEQGRLAPVDLALGWGPMSNPAVLAHIGLRQDRRFLFTTVSRGAPIDEDTATENVANIHVVPATKAVADKIAQIRRGDLVTITGHLANIEGPDGFRWETSLSRTDTGNGACELLLVDSVIIHERALP